MDIGCNRGLVAFEFFANGATLVHGCDNYVDGIETAAHLFADLRNCESKFEVVDLSRGFPALAPFGNQRYDIVVMLATYHKLNRIMAPQTLSALMKDIGNRTKKYFGWRATSDKPGENEIEMRKVGEDMAACGLKRIHTSYISEQLGVAAIWRRG